ncbi:hypothetical protein AERO9A_330122 [Aeromonas salmonicida]|nr:hypothetical protein AERO9A_330122 [Aeromonas salmonicida]
MAKHKVDTLKKRLDCTYAEAAKTISLGQMRHFLSRNQHNLAR